MIKVFVPDFCYSEISYVLDVVLSEFLGVCFVVEIHSERDFMIKTAGKTLRVDATFFCQIKDTWLDKASLNNLSLEHFDCSDLKINASLNNLPIFFGNPAVLECENEINIGFDIFGFIFMMLSRYEEAISERRDAHSRFPDSESIMYKYGLAKRPTVNEYTEVLWCYLSKCDPAIIRRSRGFRKKISCDVDHPFDVRSLSVLGAFKRSIANLTRHWNMKFLLTDICHFVLNIAAPSSHFDRYYNNLNYIMDVNDQHNNVVSFNFIPLRTHPKYDDDNRIDDPQIIAIIDKIRQRGHEVGFHPGYETSTSLESFIESADLFWDVFSKRRKGQQSVGGRQHYLRFDILKSPAMWQNSGFDYDSSMGFSQDIGFRSGVCFEYPMYDLLKREKLTLRQVPLVAMEGGGLKRHDSSFHYSEDVIADFEKIKSLVKMYSGDYTLLWHNSHFNKKDDFRLFEQLIR
jgi:hypothetical protein